MSNDDERPWPSAQGWLILLAVSAGVGLLVRLLQESLFDTSWAFVTGAITGAVAAVLMPRLPRARKSS